MKRLLLSLSFICIVLLSGIYYVGEKTETTLQQIFSKSELQGGTSKLLSYKKNFFQAVVVSQLSFAIEGEKPVVFTVTSTIQHYPYKALIKNDIHIVDPHLAATVQNYFGNKNWISSTEEISLLGKLSGELKLLPGRYQYEDEHIETKALALDYQIDFRDDSGTFNVNWLGANVLTNSLNLSLDSVKLNGQFNTLPVITEYSYVTEIAEMVIEQQGQYMQMQGIELLGSGGSGKQKGTVDSSNEWKVASYRIDNGVEKVFTDNHLKLELKGLSASALTLLSNASNDPNKVANSLSVLMAQGAQLSLPKLISKTPWGEVSGSLDVTLQKGAQLSEIVINPFMLLDYTSGRANLVLPEDIQQLPALFELLQVGLQSGFLVNEGQNLTLDTQLKQGELIVNGRVIPL